MVSLLGIWFMYNYCTLVLTVPVTIQPGNQLNTTELHSLDVNSVCVHNDVIYPSGKNFTTDDPCETCTCDPPKYTCAIQSCDVNPGCKAVQIADVCCPEYVCECENNGKIYGNGEKVEEPNPCKVCYCSGGQIKCVFITCYFRDDCKPIYVKGRCCPKYDHCPPLEKMKNKTKMSGATAVKITDLVLGVHVEEKSNTGITLGSVTNHHLKHPFVPTLEVIEIHATESVRAFFPFQTLKQSQVPVTQQEIASDSTTETVLVTDVTEFENSSELHSDYTNLE